MVLQGKNIGYGNLINKDVKIRFFDLDSGTDIQEIDLGSLSLEPGGFVSRSFTHTLDGNTAHYAFMIDSHDSIVESNESNNLYHASDTTTSWLLNTNLRFTDIHTDPLVPVHGNGFEWVLKVMNEGPGDEWFQIYYEVLNESNTVVDEGWIDKRTSIHPGDTSHELRLGNLVAISGFTYRFDIRGNDKPETNTDDNIISIEIDDLM